MSDRVLSQKRRLFDLWAPSYDRLFPSVFYQAIHKRLLEYIQLPEKANILDLGCGTGRLLDRLAAQFPTLQGTGIDLSVEMLRVARDRNRHHPRLIFIQGNAEALPFADWQFDAVFNTVSFLHYPDPDRVLSEVSRVLHPGGHFYLVDFTLGGQTAAQLPGNIRFYSATAREQLGKSAGLNSLGHYYLLGPVLLSVFTKNSN